MGFFTNVVHNIGQGVGQAARVLDKGVSAGFGAARRVVSAASRAGNTIQRVASKANQLTGGALDIITDDIPGVSAVKGAFKTGLAVVNRADKALNRAEGAYQRGKKRAREIGGRVQGIAQGAAKAADTVVENAIPAAKRARSAAQGAFREAQRAVSGLRDSVNRA